jgi:hypothetical protein
MAAGRQESRMIRWLAAASLVSVALSGGCATSRTAPERFTGTAGPISWQVVDIGQVVASENRGLRWSYTVSLTNTGGSSIRFEHVEHALRAHDMIGGSLTRRPFERTLAPGAETRASFVETWQYRRGESVPFGGSATLETLTVDRRFVGQDERGASVVVPVIMHFDRSVGKVSTPRPRVAPPASDDVRPSDVTQLAGTWQGHYRRRDGLYEVPLRLEVSRDGSFEAFENDPVTNRFRGRLQVEDGRVKWQQGSDSGALTFHQGSGRRLLVGAFSGSRTTAGTSYTVTWELWLEANLPTAWAPPVSLRTESSSPAAAPTSTYRLGLPPAVQRAFDTYQSDRKYSNFRAFATDRGSGVWGEAWSHPSAASAAARALKECGKKSEGCEVYAVGDTVLETVSPDRRAALLLGGAQLKFTGVLTTEHGDRVEALPTTVYLSRGLTEMTGSWTSGPGIAGAITGGVLDTLQATVKLTQTRPCVADYTGAVSIGGDGTTLNVSYTGPGCDGVPLKGAFTGRRQ